MPLNSLWSGVVGTLGSFLGGRGGQVGCVDGVFLGGLR